MKKLLKNYKASWVVVVAVIALSIVGGGYRSVRREARKVEKLFYASETSGFADFTTRTGLCSNLLTVAQRYMDTSEPVYTALTQAVKNAKEAGDIWQVAEANESLTSAFDALYLALGAYDLSETDAGYHLQIYRNFYSYGDILRRVEYNTAAADYNQEVLGAFPASLIAGITGIRPLPVFE